MTRWLTTSEAAEMMGMEEATLRGWRAEERGPRYYKLSARCVKYAQSDVELYVNERLVIPCERGIERVHAPR